MLFVPVDQAARFLAPAPAAATATARPDAVIIDLEDSVPEPAKAAAREALQRLVSELPPRGSEAPAAYVRLNALGTPHGDADLQAAGAWLQRGYGVMLSKCGSPDELQAAAARAPQPLGAAVLPLIETLAGYARREALMHTAAALGLPLAAFGAGDMSLELGIERDYGLALLQQLMMQLVLTAKVHGIGVIDAPSRCIPSERAGPGWMQGLIDECRWSAANGFVGKLAVHPEQIGALHAAFDRGPRLAWARRVLADFAAAAGKRAVVSSTDGRYMGTPTLKQARAIVAELGPPAGPGSAASPGDHA